MSRLATTEVSTFAPAPRVAGEMMFAAFSALGTPANSSTVPADTVAPVTGVNPTVPPTSIVIASFFGIAAITMVGLVPPAGVAPVVVPVWLSAVNDATSPAALAEPAEILISNSPSPAPRIVRSTCSAAT